MATPVRSLNYTDVVVGGSTKASDINTLADDAILAFTEFDGGNTASLPASPVLHQKFMDTQADILYACFDVGTWHPIASDITHIDEVRVHIIQAGTIGTPTVGSEDLLVLQKSAIAGDNCLLAIISGNAGISQINFGDTDSENPGRIRYDHNNNSMDFFTAGSEKMTIDSSGRIGVNKTVPIGQLDVDQSSTTGARPVLYLDQADLSEEFIRFDAAEAVGNPVEDVGAKTLTVTKFVRVNVNGTDLYIQVGTIA